LRKPWKSNTSLLLSQVGLTEVHLPGSRRVCIQQNVLSVCLPYVFYMCSGVWRNRQRSEVTVSELSYNHVVWWTLPLMVLNVNLFIYLFV
jgi:hypothetical protein